MQSNAGGKLLDMVLGRPLIFLVALYGRLRRLLNSRYRADISELDIQSILVLKMCCLGDGILALPAIRALKHKYPDAALTVVCTPRNEDVFIGQPFIDRVEVLELTGFGGLKEVLLTGPVQFVRAAVVMRQIRPQIAVDLDLYFNITSLLAFVSGAVIRAGFDMPHGNRGRLYTHSARRDPDRHEALCFSDIVASFGVQAQDMHISLWKDPEAAESAAGLLADNQVAKTDSYAVLAPGSSRNWPVKRWPVARFAEIGRYLCDELGMRVVIIGAAFEQDIGEQLADMLGETAIDLTGRTSIRQSIELLRDASIVVSNDSGPMHMAAAVGIPVIGLFGPTNPKKWRPWTDRGIAVIADSLCPKAPCYYLSRMPACDARECMGELKVQQVKDAISLLVDETGSGQREIAPRELCDT
ncbi:MAG: glycosyltransferase family 9 protein [Armatimonadota bacterium]